MKIECPFLLQFPGLKHAFFEANADILKASKVRAMEALAGCSLPLVTLKQVHGNKAIHVTGPLTEEVEADGLVTCVRGLALGILTADCGPVLFYDPTTGVIGACHAGWRGAKSGIIQETVKAMEDIGAVRSQIYATLGPTIQQMNYEVGPEFPDLFSSEPYNAYFLPAQKKGHHFFNLPRYILDQLLKEKISQIYDVEKNTFTGPFASRRRFLSQGLNPVNVNNLSAIAIM